MITATYRIADKNIEINSIFDEVHYLCADYKHEGPIDFAVKTTVEDIEYERQDSIRTREIEGLPPYDFPDSYLETLAVYRQICETLFKMDYLLIHGSAIAVDGVCYLFTAKSGTGKSTHTRIWRKVFGNKALMVNDDKPIVKIPPEGTNEMPTIYGTPWDGKHHLSTNTSMPLKAICFLQRGETNRIEPATGFETYKQLMQQTYIPRDYMYSLEYTDLLGRLTQNVKLYRLWCNMEDEAAWVAYNGMK